MPDFPPPGDVPRSFPPPVPPAPVPSAQAAFVFRDGQDIPPSPTKGPRTATLALFWCIVGAAWVVVIATINRRRAFDEFRRGDAPGSEVDDADAFVAGAAFVQIGLTVAGVIVLSIWSLRTARYVKQFGAVDVSPGLACGGWYIPFGNLVVPFVQLRRIARLRRRAATAINWWQGLFIAQFVAGGGFRSVADIETAESFDDLSGRLTSQIVLAVASAALLTAAAIAAVRATRDVDGL